jgi:hypothetical protein
MQKPSGVPAFVLIHSPVVGPTTWSPVARELKLRARTSAVPSLLDMADAAPPQWRHAQDAVRAATADLADPLVLVGHSGAGVLLPVIADALATEVAALILVDAFLPPESGTAPPVPPELMPELEALASDGVLPPWSSWLDEDALRELVPDEPTRAALVREMPRMPLTYFQANIPMPDGWSRRPCAYLLFSADHHGASAADARSRGWAVAEIPGAHHLTMVADPIAVTEALLGLERELGRHGR